jgi:hypothetical protein
LVTIWVAWRQLQDARVLQRAYVSALPGGVSTTTRGELLAHVEFKNVGHLPASQIKSLLKFTASDDGEWSPPPVDDKDLRPAGVLPIGISVTTGSHGIGVPQPWPKYLYAWGGSLIWMASVRSGGRIFAIATTPKSEKPQLAGLSSFAKSTVVTTNMGTTQIRREPNDNNRLQLQTSARSLIESYSVLKEVTNRRN